MILQSRYDALQREIIETENDLKMLEEQANQHGRANTLRQALKGIKRHDKWQLNGRMW